MSIEDTGLEGLPVQRNSEPMITMTVRQRDILLYRIKELQAKVEMLEARIAGMKVERTDAHG